MCYVKLCVKYSFTFFNITHTSIFVHPIFNKETGRTGFDLDAFRSKYNMSEHPIAANYFQVENDEFVENIDESCSVSEKQEVEEAADDIKIHALPILNSRFL